MTPTALVFAATVLAMLPAFVPTAGAAAAGTSGRGTVAAALPAGTALDHASADKPSSRTFHVAYTGGDDAGDLAFSLELIVSRPDRKISGVFQMTRPVKMWSHVDGSYTQSSPTGPDVVSLVGRPGARSCGPFLGHGLPVFENTRISLRLEPGWQGGTGDVSFPPGRNPGFAPTDHPKWIDVSGIKLSGGVPTHWRGVTDLEHTIDGTSMPWPTTCAVSSGRLRPELERLGQDSSARDLELRSTTGHDGVAPIQWFVHNSSGNHILARYVCENKRSPVADRTLQIYPFEDVFLAGFLQESICRLETSHFD